jgi:hypothetical protein
MEQWVVDQATGTSNQLYEFRKRLARLELLVRRQDDLIQELFARLEEEAECP